MDRKKQTSLATLALVAFLGTAAFAQDAPYRRAWPVRPGQTNTARIFLPPQAHPAVAVSRTLAAQPVHPFMVKVAVGGSGDSGPLTTWIDPLARLDGAGRLDENHSLVKSQRLFNSLRGLTTEQLNALRNDSLARMPRAAAANCARLVYPHVRPAPADPPAPFVGPLPAADRHPGRIIRPQPADPPRRFDLKVFPAQPRPADSQHLLVQRNAGP